MSVNSNGYIHLGGNIRNIYILLLLSLSFSIVLGGYDVGDTISESHQNMEFGFCYPEEQAGDIFSFAQHNGDLNDSNYQVLMIDRAASW